MTIYRNIRFYQGIPSQPEKYNPVVQPVISLESLIAVVFMALLLAWVLNRIITAGYKGSFQYRHRCGTKITAEISPHEKKL
jgi:hypothetical protein